MSSIEARADAARRFDERCADHCPTTTTRTCSARTVPPLPPLAERRSRTLFYVEPDTDLTSRASGRQPGPTASPPGTSTPSPARRAAGSTVRPRRGLLAVLADAASCWAWTTPSWRSWTTPQSQRLPRALREGPTVLGRGAQAAAGRRGPDLLGLRRCRLLSSRQYAGSCCPTSGAGRGRPRAPRAPVYTHTCGAIGDRLDLMAGDGHGRHRHPRPAAARYRRPGRGQRLIGGRFFLKGNIDPGETRCCAERRRTSSTTPRRLRSRRREAATCSAQRVRCRPAALPENVLRLSEAAEA